MLSLSSARADNGGCQTRRVHAVREGCGLRCWTEVETWRVRFEMGVRDDVVTATRLRLDRGGVTTPLRFGAVGSCRYLPSHRISSSSIECFPHVLFCVAAEFTLVATWCAGEVFSTSGAMLLKNSSTYRYTDKWKCLVD